MNEERIAYCGLWCDACSVYVASQYNQDRLQVIADKMKVSVEEMHCNGCKADTISMHCRNCNIKACCLEKGFQSCAECKDVPCDILKEFQPKMPHRAELFKSLDNLEQHGKQEWFAKMQADFGCPQCGTANSPYYIKCRVCGNMPASRFVADHMSELLTYLKQSN